MELGQTVKSNTYRFLQDDETVEARKGLFAKMEDMQKILEQLVIGNYIEK